MSVRMKITHSKTGSRRAHHHTGVPCLTPTKTGVRRRHFIDPDTGVYRGRQIIIIGKPEKATSAKAAKKTTEKATKESKVVTKEAKADETK
jgi:ribosomal protein L32